MKKLLLLVLFCPILVLNAQFRYKIITTPESVPILMNGEEKCTSPCRVKFYWSQKIDGKIVFSIDHPNYKSWSDTIREKPSNFNFNARINLERKVPFFKLDKNAPLIDFNKLIAIFQDGTVLGKITHLNGSSENIEWSGHTKIGEDAFKRKFYVIADKAGLRTPISTSAELFSESNPKSLPRYVVGVKLIDYKINKRLIDEKDYGAGRYKCKTELIMEWQVLDKSTDEIVLRYQNTGTCTYRENYVYQSTNNIYAFEDSFLDFLQNSDFVEHLKNSKDLKMKAAKDSVSAPSTNIEKIAPAKYQSFSSMIKGVSNSCITVITDGGHGSGFFISKDGYLLTAHHVINGVNKIKVKLKSELELDAKLISYDQKTDLALLKVDGSGFKPLAIANKATELGDDLITIGTPADVELGQSISRGILSGKRLTDGLKYLQIDLSISPGNSGGPLMNKRGEVVGVVQSKLVDEAIDGIGFAFPIVEALEALNLTIIEK